MQMKLKNPITVIVQDWNDKVTKNTPNGLAIETGLGTVHLDEGMCSMYDGMLTMNIQTTEELACATAIYHKIHYSSAFEKWRKCIKVLSKKLEEAIAAR